MEHEYRSWWPVTPPQRRSKHYQARVERAKARHRRWRREKTQK